MSDSSAGLEWLTDVVKGVSEAYRNKFGVEDENREAAALEL
jgi:hypothetical protein